MKPAISLLVFLSAVSLTGTAPAHAQVAETGTCGAAVEIAAPGPEGTSADTADVRGPLYMPYGGGRKWGK